MKKTDMVKVLAMAGALAAALAGCGGSGAGYQSTAQTVYEAADEAAYDTAAYDYGDGGMTGAAMNAAEYTEDAVAEEGTAADIPADALAGRKLIKNVSLNVETEQFDALVPNLEKRVTALGGYIEDMSSYSRNDNYSSDFAGTKYLRYANMTVRIPKENLDVFLEEVGQQSNIVSRSESVTDVTLQYVDLESHKKALTTEQDRLIQLMEQAETVEDIITIEGRLSEVRYQLESMESQLRTFDNKIDYSTVYLSIDEVERYTPTEDVTAGERIRDGFMDSVKGVGRGVGNAAIWFVVNLPYLALWAVIVVMILLVMRLIGRVAVKRKKKKAARTRDPYPAQNPCQQQNPYPVKEPGMEGWQGGAGMAVQEPGDKKMQAVDGKQPQDRV